jgi:hypothetical protein
MINHKQAHHALILGCGRSGTSIFGAFFQTLNSYQYYSEPAYVDLKHYNYTQPIAIKVPRESENFPATVGLSFPLADLLETIPNPKTIFWIVRHPLDAICSLKVGISRNWGHHPRPLDWKEHLDQPLILRCAHHWNYINTIGFDKVKDRVVICHYENLVLDATAFSNKIAKAVNLDIEKEKENIQTWCNRVQNRDNQQFIEPETSRPYSTKDHKVKVGRWKENMTLEERAMVLPIIEETAVRFGYDLSID